MKEFLDYVVKNKWVIICVAVVVILYALGIVEFLTKAVILVALLAGAVYLGKFIQDHEDNILDFFKGKGKQEVYIYKEETSKKSKKEDKE